MTNGSYALVVDGERIPLRKFHNVRFVTPARDAHPGHVVARLARSSRLAIDPTYPGDSIIIWGPQEKLAEVPTYTDVQNTRSAFHDPTGKLLILTNEILISFADNSTGAEREGLLAQFDGRIVEKGPYYWTFHVNTADEDAPLSLALELSEQDLVTYAEPNALQAATFHQLPQDEPRFADQWHLRNTGQNNGVANADVAAIGAWIISTGSTNIRIVVHDSGVDINHPDLAGNMDPGWDFDNDDDDPTNNARPHGTASAGIVAAAVNGQGVTGVAPRCRIVPLRANSLTWARWAATFDWAAQRGEIISCSWSITPNNTLSAAIRRAVNRGVAVFCATGNFAETTNGIEYPASLAETIAVGASTNEDVRAGYSQFGNGLDVVAPSSGGTLRIETTDVQDVDGYNTQNTQDGGDYCNANDGTGFGGTSAATPLVAGIAGLLLSVDPSLTPDEVRIILRNTAVKIDAGNAAYDENGWSEQYGFGRVSAAEAVNRAVQLSLADGKGLPWLILLLGGESGPP